MSFSLFFSRLCSKIPYIPLYNSTAPCNMTYFYASKNRSLRDANVGLSKGMPTFRKLCTPSPTLAYTAPCTPIVPKERFPELKDLELSPWLQLISPLLPQECLPLPQARAVTQFWRFQKVLQGFYRDGFNRGRRVRDLWFHTDRILHHPRVDWGTSPKP